MLEGHYVVSKNCSCGNMPYYTVQKVTGYTCGGTPNQFETIGVIAENLGCGSTGFKVVQPQSSCGNPAPRCGSYSYYGGCGGCSC